MATVKLPATQDDVRAISRIARRYVKAMVRLTRNDFGAQIPTTGAVAACLLAVHEAEGPLDLAKLESFPDPDFCHDVGGMFRYAAFPSGKLGPKFWPRCGSRSGKSDAV
jgi:hypothetical protein